MRHKALSYTVRYQLCGGMAFPEPEPEHKEAEWGFLALFVGVGVFYLIVRMIFAMAGE